MLFRSGKAPGGGGGGKAPGSEGGGKGVYYVVTDTTDQVCPLCFRGVPRCDVTRSELQLLCRRQVGAGFTHQHPRRGYQQGPNIASCGHVIARSVADQLCLQCHIDMHFQGSDAKYLSNA